MLKRCAAEHPGRAFVGGLVHNQRRLIAETLTAINAADGLGIVAAGHNRTAIADSAVIALSPPRGRPLE